MKNVSRFVLRDLAIVGVKTRLAALYVEREELEQHLAALTRTNGTRVARAVTPIPLPSDELIAPTKRRARKPWTAAQKKAVSRRMRAYWKSDKAAKRRVSAS